MALSVVDLYRDVLPKTNCGDCGHPTCLAFASMVVSEKLPLKNCPHLSEELIQKCNIELAEQYAAGKWLKRDMAQDALEWARERASSMVIEDLPNRLGGKLIVNHDGNALLLPYFNEAVIITKDSISKEDGSELTRWEQVFLYNHVAQGGSGEPTGVWKGFVEFPNTVSKIKSMVNHVEIPLKEHFKGQGDVLLNAGKSIGGKDMAHDYEAADVAVFFRPLPRIPVMVLFWDQEKEEDFEARVKLMFDETIIEHLDLESIIFLSERLRELLCEY